MPVEDDNPSTSPASDDANQHIDCVLVYVEESEIGSGKLITENSSAQSPSAESKKIIRKDFEKYLTEQKGLILRHHEVQKTIRKYSHRNPCCPKSIQQTIHYVTIHTPFHVLLSMAEKMRMKLPVEVSEFTSIFFFRSFCTL